MKAQPVRYRPHSGHFGPVLLRPSLRYRLRLWWWAHRWDVARDALLTLSFLVMFLALNAVINGALALLNWAGW